MTEAMAQLPQYQCHKKVWALKVKSIDFAHADDDTIIGTITPEDAGYAPFNVDEPYLHKHKPHAGGYYVVYADGYKSFSPADAFESGYTLIQPTSFQDRVRAEKAELDDKLDKLNAFFKTTIFSGLPIEQQEPLEEQARHMSDYSDVLGRRIASFA